MTTFETGYSLAYVLISISVLLFIFCVVTFGVISTNTAGAAAVLAVAFFLLRRVHRQSQRGV